MHVIPRDHAKRTSSNIAAAHILPVSFHSLPFLYSFFSSHIRLDMAAKSRAKKVSLGHLTPTDPKHNLMAGQVTPMPKAVSDDIHMYRLDRYSKESVGKQISIPETITALDTYPPLLRIPSEIRREIFRYVLPSSNMRFLLYTDCDSNVISKKWNRKCRPHPDKHLRLDVLRTSRLIYHECLSVMYSENLFHFYAFNYLPVLDFIRHLSPEAKSLVRKVRLTPLTDKQNDPPASHDIFCTVIHDSLPGLSELQADPVVFF